MISPRDVKHEPRDYGLLVKPQLRKDKVDLVSMAMKLNHSSRVHTGRSKPDTGNHLSGREKSLLPEQAKFAGVDIPEIEETDQL